MDDAAEPINKREPVDAGLFPGAGARAPLTFEPEALGRLKRELTWTLGPHRANGIAARWGLTCGMRVGFDPNHRHLLSGLGQIQMVSGDPATDEYVVEARASCEAAEHRRFNPLPAKEPRCWGLAGYLTGLVSAVVGHPVVFLEARCVARGDTACTFIGKRRADWPSEYHPHLEIFEEDNIADELRETRTLLQATRDRYQNLFEQSNMPILIIDPDTAAYLDANLAAVELVDRGREELLAMTAFDLLPPAEHNKLMLHMKSLMNGEYTHDFEVRLLRKDGSERTIAQSSKVLSYGGRKAIQSVMRDITDLKTAAQKEHDLQQQLSRSERLSSIGRLAASVAHEIKNPLGAIQNALYYVRGALKDNPVMETDPQLREIIKLGEEEVGRAVMIIEELLDFSHVIRLVPRKTQINELIEKLPAIVPVPDNIDMVLDLDVTLPKAMADPDRLRQVFCNIMSNAFQAMSQGGRLTVKTWMELEAAGEENDREVIAVAFEDTGPGIEALHLKKIFEPLFTTKAQGTGLGLAIANNIIEKHDGAILVTSQKGRGSTFTIRLPTHPDLQEE